jgi:hypothetical protein
MPAVSRASHVQSLPIGCRERRPQIAPQASHLLFSRPCGLNLQTSQADFFGCWVVWVHGLTAVFGGVCRRLPCVLRGLSGNRRQILIEQKKLTTLVNASPFTETHL